MSPCFDGESIHQLPLQTSIHWKLLEFVIYVKSARGIHRKTSHAIALMYVPTWGRVVYLIHPPQQTDTLFFCFYFTLFLHTGFIGRGLPLLFYASRSVIKQSNFKYNCSWIVRIKSSHSAQIICYPLLFIIQSTIRHLSFVINQFFKFALIKI